DVTGGHEIGHNLGRHHTLCTGGEDGADSSYPYPGGVISGTAANPNQFYGFDVETHEVIGTNYHDIMSYCDFEWPSDYTYKGILSVLGPACPGPTFHCPLRPLGDYVSVLGHINEATFNVEMAPMHRLTQTPAFEGSLRQAFP